MIYRHEHLLRSCLIVLWAAAVTGAYYLSEMFNGVLLIRFFIYLFLNPALLLAGSFMLAKTFGAKWYYTAAVIAASAVIYFITPVRNVVPNLIIVTAVCTVFGSGVGSVFAPPEDNRESKKESYTPILSESNINKKKAKK